MIKKNQIKKSRSNQKRNSNHSLIPRDNESPQILRYKELREGPIYFSGRGGEGRGLGKFSVFEFHFSRYSSAIYFFSPLSISFFFSVFGVLVFFQFSRAKIVFGN